MSLPQKLHRLPRFSLGDQVPRPEPTQSEPAKNKTPFQKSVPVTNLKAVMKLNKLLATGRTPGPPVPFHPPWKKTRVFPMMEKPQSVESTKTPGSDSSESGMIIDGIFFQTKEKSKGQKLFFKQLHTHNNCQSDTSKTTDSSSGEKIPGSQESSDLEREPCGFVSTRQQSPSKVERVNGGYYLDTYFDRCALSSISTFQNPYSDEQSVAYMTSFDSDREQEMSEPSNSRSSSEMEHEDSEIESKTQTEQDSETETDTESEMETETGTKLKSNKDLGDGNVLESRKETETGDLSGSRRAATGTQEFVRSVLQTMNQTQSYKPPNPSSVAEISSTVGFNFTSNMYRVAQEAMLKAKAKKEENKEETNVFETENKDPVSVVGQEKDSPKSSNSQSTSSSSAGSGYTQGDTDKGNLPPIVEDEEEEMTFAGSLRSSPGNTFQRSSSVAGSPVDDKEDSDNRDTVTPD